MARSLIVFFSQGGTTAQVAERIASGLKGSGFNQADLYNLKEANPPEPNAYNLLGVGFPAYFFKPPFNVMDYILSLPDLAGMPFFTFLLYGSNQGDTAKAARRMLIGKGGREVGYFSARGEDFFYGFLKMGYLFSPDHPSAEELRLAEEFGAQVAERAFRGPGKYAVAPAPSLGPVYRLERFLSNRWLVRNVYSRLFKVNPEACSSCGMCIRLCPTGNLTAGRDGLPRWGRDCLLCLTCELKCPQEAIISPLSWAIFKVFISYNVREALKSPDLDWVRVSHSKGRTVRLTS